LAVTFANGTPLARSADMLFFELFPAFVAIVALMTGVGLIVADRSARRDESATGSKGDE
jgi:hypothetical protein